MGDYFRRGITEQEMRVADAFNHLNLPLAIEQVYCFRCRRYFRNPIKGQYPDLCQHCGFEYNAPGQYCLPDIMIFWRRYKNPEDDGVGVVFVNGGVHEKNDKHIKKDRNQIRELRAAGIKVFILKNSEIDNMTQTTLRAVCHSFWISLSQTGSALYERMMEGEKEYPAMRGV